MSELEGRGLMTGLLPGAVQEVRAPLIGAAASRTLPGPVGLLLEGLVRSL